MQHAENMKPMVFPARSWPFTPTANTSISTHICALVADGLFQRGGWFDVLPESGIRPLEDNFCVRTIAFLLMVCLQEPYAYL